MTVFEVEDTSITWGYGGIRKGPISKLDVDLQAAIANGRRRALYDDRLYVATENNRPRWWKFQSKSIARGDRVLLLMCPLEGPISGTEPGVDSSNLNF